MLEDEFMKIWCPLTGNLWKGEDTADVAQELYEIAIGKKKAQQYWDGALIKKQGKRTLTLVRSHLLEALSSSHASIREWGRLIAKEQEHA